ncbi:MAG: hypothetical protein HYZ72_16255 [Deltaproteobacteria bacterium]|nr:hypothetical protein [Deltaproteobacteria bacterium]
MNYELIAVIAAILVTSLVEVGVLGIILYKMWWNLAAIGSADFLEPRKVRQILEEIRAELQKE